MNSINKQNGGIINVGPAYYDPQYDKSIDSVIGVGPAYYDPLYDTSVATGIDLLIKPYKSYAKPIILSDDYYDTNSDILVSTTDNYGTTLSYKKRLPLITTWHPEYITPLLSTYPDFEANSIFRKKVTKYFLNLTFDKWLYGEMSDLLNYFKIDNNGYVTLIKDFSEYNPKASAKSSIQDMEKKVNFIEKYILNYDTMYRLLSRYVSESNVSWVNLPNNKYFVRKIIESKLEKLIKRAITESK